MKVEEIHDGRGGSHIEPPLQSYWSEEAKLDWKASVVSLESGVPITVRQLAPRQFSVVISGFSSITLEYRSAWDYLTGLGSGAEYRRWVQS